MRKRLSTLLHHSRHRVKHYTRRHPRGAPVLFIAILLNMFLIVQLYANTRVYPHTMLGPADVSRKTNPEIHALIESWLTTPYQVKIKDRTYTYTYRDMGVSIDEQATAKELFAPNRTLPPVSTTSLLASFFSTRTVSPRIIFTQQFYQFVSDTVYDFSDIPDTIEFSQQDKSVVLIENEEQYRMDAGKLRQLILDRLSNNTLPFYPKLVKVENKHKEEIVDFANRLNAAFHEPLSVYANAGGKMHNFFLPEADLRAITTITLADAHDDVVIAADEAPLNAALSRELKKQGFILKGPIANPKVAEDFVSVMRGRFFGNSVDALSIIMDQGPNTTGSYAGKYIEVDISQQMMYLFKDKKLVKSYKVSTGLEYPTPVGEFKILNKVGLGFSNIYQNWLPWWMGFEYSKELNAYFGIHEVPYTLSPEGKQLQPTNFIGTPNTGGCVALAPGAAREVYRFADIDTPVVIFQ